MCINYTFSYEIKNKFISGIDKFNVGLLDFFVNFEGIGAISLFLRNAYTSLSEVFSIKFFIFLF